MRRFSSASVLCSLTLVTSAMLVACGEEDDGFVQQPTNIDEDGDGVKILDDCNDKDADVNPNQKEVCDDKDNNCDKKIDEDVRKTFYRDIDGDSYGNSAEYVSGCSQPTGYSDKAGDCADFVSTINPSAVEICDEVDNNCNLDVDEGVTKIFYVDVDLDGYGSSAQTQNLCNAIDGFVENVQDCNDNDATINPKAVEFCDLIDNNCNNEVDESVLITFYLDKDGDSYGDNNLDTTKQDCKLPEGYSASNEDCDDNNPSIYPLAEELCDYIDNDCNEDVDDGAIYNTYYVDTDSDGFGDTDAEVKNDCYLPTGYASEKDDCNDTNPLVYPQAQEVCDHEDNDCDHETDEDSTFQTYYFDKDLDRYGDLNEGGYVSDCMQPSDMILQGGDCNDDDSNINPLVEELCDDIDNNCNDANNEGLEQAYYPDKDDDGFGSNQDVVYDCKEPTPPEGEDFVYLKDSQDCDDSDASINPKATEVCDEFDNDCDLETNEGFIYFDYYIDNDGDSFGVDSADTNLSFCSKPEGYAEQVGDCNDEDLAVNPNAVEVCNRVDDDCNESIDDGKGAPQLFYLDKDNDGFGDGVDLTAIESCSAGEGRSSKRGDCLDKKTDDKSPEPSTVYPGATDKNGDGIDQDCGGTDNQEQSVGLSSKSAKTLQDAINSASNGSTIWVAPNYIDGAVSEYSVNNLVFNGKSLTIKSTEFSSKTILDGEFKSPIFSFQTSDSNIVVDGFTIKNGYSSSAGGVASIFDGAKVTFKNSVFKNNIASKKGGAFFIYDSADVNFDSCTFIGNEAYSGAVVGKDLHTRFDNANQSDLSTYGGALYLDNATTYVYNTVFNNNWSLSAGGAIYIKDSELEISKSTLVNNRSEYGGAVYFSGDSSSSKIDYNIIAYNAWYNLYFEEGTTLPEVSDISHNDLYNAFSENHNYGSDITSESENQSVDPVFLTYSNDSNAENDDLHLSSETTLMTNDTYWGAEHSLYYLDNDQDGMHDGWEHLHGLDSDFDDSEVDTDSDGLLNKDEFFAGTKPEIMDTDKDGALDSLEVLDNATDPRNWFEQPNETEPVAIVPKDFPTIQKALDAVWWSGSVAVESGEFRENLFIANKSVLLSSTLASTSTIVNGANGPSTLVVQSADVNIKNMTLSTGTAEYHPELPFAGVFGGGMAVFNSTGDLSNLIVSESHADVYGGGMFLYHSPLKILSIDLNNNGSNFYGGAVAIYQSSPNILGGTISDNDATFGGAGIYAYESYDEDLEADDDVSGIVALSIKDNYVGDGYGAGISLIKSPALIKKINFEKNEAHSAGGIYLYESDASITDSTFYSNVAYLKGGAIWANQSDCNISASDFTYNQASYYPANKAALLGYGYGQGGAIYIENSLANIEYGMVSYNKAFAGGGIMLSGNSSFSEDTVLNNLQVTYNSANQYGGGLFFNGENSPTVMNSVIAENTLSIYSTEDGYSTASAGGGVAIIDNSRPSFFNTVFALNSTPKAGGSIYISSYLSTNDDITTLTNCIVTSNKGPKPSNENGVGGVYLANGANIDVTNSILDNNQEYNVYSVPPPLNGFPPNNLYEHTPGGYMDASYSNFYNSYLYAYGTYTYNLSIDPQYKKLTDVIETCDFHLETYSGLRNSGTPDLLDVDESLSDMGVFGGPYGGSWDLDHDNYPNYFWTGDFIDDPEGFNYKYYDCNDLNKDIQSECK